MAAGFGWIAVAALILRLAGTRTQSRELSETPVLASRECRRFFVLHAKRADRTAYATKGALVRARDAMYSCK